MRVLRVQRGFSLFPGDEEPLFTWAAVRANVLTARVFVRSPLRP
jgi:hypothetical protein